MKILIVRLGRIGDMILTTQMFSAIKRKMPDAEISVLASVANNSIIRNNPNVDKILVWDKSPLKLITLIAQLRSIHYNYLIDAKDHPSRESGIIARLVKADVKIGFNPPGKSYYKIGINSEKENKGLHFAMRSFEPLAYLNILPPAFTPCPELFPSDGALRYVDTFLEDAGERRILVINISASNRGKMWDNDKWVEFISAIDVNNYFPILTYAPADSDVAAVLLERISINEFKSRSMDDVIALISKSDLIITPDTSLVHVAAAFDIPLFGLFSGLNDFFEKFRPLSSTYEVVRSPEGIDGIREISAAQAIEGFRKLLKQLD